MSYIIIFVQTTVLFSGCAILVQYCRTDTTREWLDTTRTTRTGHETMVYGLYRSWINGDMHIISNTALQPRRYDPYDSYGSWNNGLRVVQLVKCISLQRLTVYIQVHDSYDSWNNGSPDVQLVNCIDIYILMISNYTTRDWMAGVTNMLRKMHVLPSENVNAPKRKTWRIFFVLKAWEPYSAWIHIQCSLESESRRG